MNLEKGGIEGGFLPYSLQTGHIGNKTDRAHGSQSDREKLGAEEVPKCPGARRIP